MRRCFVCLQIGHTRWDCTSRSKCFFCKERHHMSICMSTQEPQSLGKSSHYNTFESQHQFSQSSACPMQNARQVEAPSCLVSTNLYISQYEQNQTTLLQTAKAEVHEISNPLNSCNIRLIQSSCSQKSYVAARLRDRLNVPTVKSKKV